MRRAGRALLALLFPQQNICHACGAPLQAGEALLCPACGQTLRAYAYSDARRETVLGANLACVASAYRYQGPTRALAHGLKFGADRAAALPLAEGLAQAFAETPALRQAEICIAVPSHYRHERRRGYNQAQVLCDAFADLVGLPVGQGALVRLHQKRSQVGQGFTQRRRNVAGAFVVGMRWQGRLTGARVLLVDDVLTTGATCEACAEALYQAGAAWVAALTACRV